MRFIEIYDKLQEGIPMGKKALNTPTKKNYTFGAELEMLVDENDIVNKLDVEDVKDVLRKSKISEYISGLVEDKIIKEYGYKTETIEQLVSNSPEVIIDILTNVSNVQLPSGSEYYNPKKYFDKSGFSDTLRIMNSYDNNTFDNVDQKKNFLLDLATIRHVFFENRGDVDQLITVVNKLSENEVEKYISTYTDKVQQYLTEKPINDITDKYTITKDGKIFNLRSVVQRFVKGWNLSSIKDLLEFLITKNIMTFSLLENNSDEYEDFIEGFVDEYMELHKTDAYDYVEDIFKSQVKFQDVVPDTSVFEVNRQGVELIIGVYPDMNSFLGDLEKSFKIIQNDPKLSTNELTGLHINIGTFNSAEIENIDLLKFLLILEGDRILAEFGREFNEYQESMKGTIGNALQAAFLNHDIKQYNVVKRFIQEFILRSSIKYHMINLSKLRTVGIIEVRAFGNEDYEYNFDLVEKNIKRVIRALELAQDMNAYKTEYMKKLAKYIDSTDNSYPKEVHDILTDMANITNQETPRKRTYGHSSNFLSQILTTILRSRDNADFESLENIWKPSVGTYYIQLMRKDIQNNISLQRSIKEQLKDYIENYEVEKYAPKMVADFRKFKMI